MEAGVEWRRAVPSGCLSGWSLSRLAAGTLGGADAARAEGHAASCVRCAELLGAERAMVGAAALEALPGPLSKHVERAAAAAARRAKPRWWVAWSGPLTLVAAAVVALVVTARGPGGAGEVPGGATSQGPDGTRVKGGVAIEATVVRGGARAATDVPFAELGRLVDGDRLKLRVRHAEGQTVRVESEEPRGWVTLYTGLIAGEGLVPVDLVAERGTRSVLRISICPAVGDCVVETRQMDVD
ncbi:MAG: hypothetical protein HYZ27_11595 [Deltaproteobacteria bacterium]|nr:hypothetical protein [Deltaproteobacteria bacterium]